MALAHRLFSGIFILVLLALGVLAYNVQPPTIQPKVTIGSTTIEVEVADSEDERERGLSNRIQLPENQGMLFVFEQAGEWSFWMKDTHIPLDMIWADSDGIIVSIVKNVQPESYPKVFTPKVPARFVLEVNGGFVDTHGIAEGMKIVIE